jgi:DNA-binding MarR family transcriptional regulator
LSTPQKVLDQLREMTGQSIVMGEAIAREVGLRPADLEVLGAIEQHGPLTAGRLGLLTGLSAAAVTGLIDRLERAGVAVRQPDPADRRRVLVAVGPDAARVSEHYTRIQRDALRVVGRRSPEELAVIEDFLRDMHEIGVRHVARLDSGRA